MKQLQKLKTWLHYYEGKTKWHTKWTFAIWT
jgi:hypothetical protein